MGIFSKKQRNEPSSATSNLDPGLWIGRKFTSGCSIDESMGNFSRVRDQCYKIVEELPVTWAVPVGAESFASTQGRATAVPPECVVSYCTGEGGSITLAMWSGVVSYGDGLGVGGPPIEMWFVPSGFDQQPIPIAGMWKMQDSSLSSIGWVESPLWGAQ